MADRSPSPEQITEAVARCHLFTACSSEDRRAIADLAKPRAHQRRDILFSQGEAADAFFLCLSGIIKVLRTTAEGQEVPLHVVRPGEIFGLAPFFLDRPYPAHAQCASTRAATLRFPRTPLLRLLRASPELALHLLGGLALKLHEFTQRFEDLTAQTVPTRLARWLLLDLAGEVRVGEPMTLPMSKRNLAAHLGATPEALSRALRRLSDEGLIQLTGREVAILNPERLAETASL